MIHSVEFIALSLMNSMNSMKPYTPVQHDLMENLPIPLHVV